VEAKDVTHASLNVSPWIQYAAAMAPVPGESESGDRYLVVPRPRGALVAVVDGLGHGVEAAKAAEVAAATVQAHAEESIIRLMQICDREMHATRGAAMILASIDGPDHTLTWLSIGNVDGILLRAAAGHPPDESVLMRGGVVGLHLPVLQAVVTPIAPGDTLILATDGVRPDFAAHVSRMEQPQRIADSICANYSKRIDDALVLVVRYVGVP
jgi:serine phosphatase RsbU (regulator of sigma subunit)